MAIAPAAKVAAVSEQRPHKGLPLVLDFNGPLLRTDLLHETAIAYVRANPFGMAAS